MRVCLLPLAPVDLTADICLATKLVAANKLDM